MFVRPFVRSFVLSFARLFVRIKNFDFYELKTFHRHLPFARDGSGLIRASCGLTGHQHMLILALMLVYIDTD